MKLSACFLLLLVFPRIEYLSAAQFISLVGQPPENRNDFDGTIGFEFIVGDSPIQVRSVGIEDARGDGLLSRHNIGFWNSSETLLSETILASGNAAPLVDIWRMVQLETPLQLDANTTYFFGASREFQSDIYSDNGLTTNAFELSDDFHPVANTLLTGSFGAPTERQLGEVPRWAFANFEFNTVPEPSSLLLSFLAGFALLARQRS